MSQENPENIQENPAPDPEPQPVSQTEPPAPQPEPAAKRRGRPEGAKDRAPRKKKVVVVEEDIPAPENTPELEAPVQEPTTVQAPEPDSPRTLIRNAAEHILKLKSVTRMARRTHLQDQYTKRLHSLS